MCACDCVRACDCVCVCVPGKWLHIYKKVQNLKKGLHLLEDFMKCHAFELLSKNCFYFLDLIISLYVCMLIYQIILYIVQKNISFA